MSVYQFTRLGASASYLLWHMEESEEQLYQRLCMADRQHLVQVSISHPRRRREWLAARVATAALIDKLGYLYRGLGTDAAGKPTLLDVAGYVSLSHSAGWVAVLFDAHHSVGIDIQRVDDRLKKLKSKFLNAEEIAAGGDEPLTLGIYWTAKEAICKMMGRRGLNFTEGIYILPFDPVEEGPLIARVGNRTFTVYYSLLDQYVLAWCLS